MLNKALLLSGSGVKNLVCDYFEFVATAAGSGVDFFNGSAPSSWVVYVNGAPTSQSANALTFSSGDTVRIEYDKTPAASFSARDKNYFKTIDGAIPVVESTNFSSCFSSCRALTSVPEGLFANNPNVTSFSSCFSSCRALTSVPEGLFANNPNVTSFSRCFERCDALTSVPEGLFANNPNVTNFISCFYYCDALTSVPEGLFANNPNATDFFSCFERCDALTSVPEGLFANNPNVTSFSSCFSSCRALTSVPEGLFANNPNVTSFSSCFESCSALIVRVRISSAKVSKASYFARSTKATGTVYVPSGSTTASTFKSEFNANVKVVEE